MRPRLRLCTNGLVHALVIVDLRVGCVGVTVTVRGYIEGYTFIGQNPKNSELSTNDITETQTSKQQQKVTAGVRY